MENLSISHIFMDNLELVDSQSVNVFKDTFDIWVENIRFRIIFIEDKKETAGADVDKVDPETYNITLYNLQNGGLRGIMKPIGFGIFKDTEYSFSITGITHKNPEYKRVVFNLFKEVKNG